MIYSAPGVFIAAYLAASHIDARFGISAPPPPRDPAFDALVFIFALFFVALLAIAGMLIAVGFR